MRRKLVGDAIACRTGRRQGIQRWLHARRQFSAQLRRRWRDDDAMTCRGRAGIRMAGVTAGGGTEMTSTRAGGLSSRRRSGQRFGKPARRRLVSRHRKKRRRKASSDEDEGRVGDETNTPTPESSSRSKSKSNIASSSPRSSKTCTAPSAKNASCSAGRRRRVCAVHSSTSVRPAGLCECYGEWSTWSSKMGKKLCIRCTKAEIWYCTLLYRGQVVVAV